MSRLLLLAVVVALSPALARAQSSAAQAEQLFKDGKTLMGKKQYAEACDAFAASQQLDPQLTTMINLADCREKNGQLATAWSLFLEVERETRNDTAQKALHDSAKKKGDALETRVSYLIINVPDESRVDGLAITRNGEPVEPVTWNRALPIDGGTYTIEGKAPGHEAWSTSVTVDTEKDKQSVDVPKFKELPTSFDTDGDDQIRVEDRPPTGEPPPPPESSGMSGKRKAGLVVGSLGFVSAIAAVALEVHARSVYDESTREPDDARQASLYDSANRFRSFAIGAGIVGAAAIAAGTFLFITGGPEEPREASTALVPTFAPDGAGLALTGAF